MSTENELKEAVERFKVCWVSFPELSIANPEHKQIGFVVELYGTYDRGDIVPTAGCEQCVPVLHALVAIAEFVVPQAWREALDVLHAHNGLEYATERGGRPDVVVSITMIPQRDGQPDAGAIGTCLADAKQRLELLGVCERAWKEGGPGPAARSG